MIILGIVAAVIKLPHLWVDMTLGIFKSWFQCLHRLKVSSERTVACVVLHNIASLSSTLPYDWMNLGKRILFTLKMFMMQELSEKPFAKIVFQISLPHPQRINQDSLFNILFVLLYFLQIQNQPLSFVDLSESNHL